MLRSTKEAIDERNVIGNDGKRKSEESERNVEENDGNDVRDQKESAGAQVHCQPVVAVADGLRDQDQTES